MLRYTKEAKRRIENAADRELPDTVAVAIEIDKVGWGKVTITARLVDEETGEELVRNEQKTLRSGAIYSITGLRLAEFTLSDCDC